MTVMTTIRMIYVSIDGKDGRRKSRSKQVDVNSHSHLRLSRMQIFEKGKLIEVRSSKMSTALSSQDAEKYTPSNDGSWKGYE